jgi:hypothetical protein
VSEAFKRWFRLQYREANAVLDAAFDNPTRENLQAWLKAEREAQARVLEALGMAETAQEDGGR